MTMDLTADPGSQTTDAAEQLGSTQQLDSAEPLGSAGPADNADDRALFSGDTGHFDLDTRRALVRLLRGPFLDGSADEKIWSALMHNDVPVRQHLAEIFLTLTVDAENRIAFVQQAEESEVAFPKLLRRVPLTLVDSALLLFLRQELSTASGTGQRAIVGLDDITAQLLPYQREGASDHSIHLKRINAAVKKLRDNGVLRTTSTESRFEISPVLRILFPPEQIAALTESYLRLASGASSGDSDDEINADVEMSTDESDPGDANV